MQRSYRKNREQKLRDAPPPEPGCNHQRSKGHGKDRNGRPRSRCLDCGATFQTPVDDEPFADDPPFDPLAASSPMRLPEVDDDDADVDDAEPDAKPARRKPGPKPKPAVSCEDIGGSSARAQAVAAVCVELSLSDRPLSLAKLAGLTKFRHSVLAQALNDPAFECEGGKYRLKEA